MIILVLIIYYLILEFKTKFDEKLFTYVRAMWVTPLSNTVTSGFCFVFVILESLEIRHCNKHA